MDDPFVAKVQSIIRAHLSPGYRMFLFGSRVAEKHHQYSDVDIGIEGDSEVPKTVMVKITDALDESDLPVKVDVVDFSKVTPEFAHVAKQARVML